MSNAAKMLVMLEAMAGLFFLAVLIARLIALYSDDRPTESTGIPDQSTRSPPSSEIQAG
jgi:hypothetical protein